MPGSSSAITTPGSLLMHVANSTLWNHGSRLTRVGVALVVALSALAAGCGDGAPTRRIMLSECRVPKLAQAVQCGTLDVPEDRQHPQGRRLSIFVAVLPANTLSPKPDP